MQQISTNLASLNARASFGRVQGELDQSVQRLSSGLRLNGARDDAAALSISTRLSAKVHGLDRAGKNTNDAISLLQTAEGATKLIGDNLQRIRELAVQAANGTNSASDRAALQSEVLQLSAGNRQIASTAQFNHINVLDGSFSGQFQIGPRQGDTLNVQIPALFSSSGALESVELPVHQVSVTKNVVGALSAGDLRINGVAVGASVAGAAAGQSAGSAYAVAAAITAADIKHIGASASTSTSVTASASAAIPANGLSINGVNVGAIAGANAAAVASAAAAAIQAVAATSGVSASASGATLSLTAADGRDIVIGETVAGYAASLGLASGTVRGQLTLGNEALAGTNNISISGSNPGQAGFVAGTLQGVDTGATGTVLQEGASIDLIDLTTAAAAQTSLDYLDAKIDAVNALRANLGATQNRLEHVLDRVQGAAGDVAAARGRITDADYAQESAQYTRNQVLQQASIAIVAQANAQPRTTLALLR